MLFILLSFSAWSEYSRYRDAVSEYKRADDKLTVLDEECNDIKQLIRDLKENPRAIERVAREEFGWCREGETIYTFPKSQL